MEKFFIAGVTLLMMFTVANSLIVIFDEPLLGYNMLNCNVWTGECPTATAPEIDMGVFEEPDLSVSAASLANPPGFIGMLADAAGAFLGGLLNFSVAWSRMLTVIITNGIPGGSGQAVAAGIVSAIGYVFTLIQFITVFWFVMKVKTGLLGGNI